ncbi:substrate-binding domain-containing protein [Glutamicibacter sp. AOP5-A2-7]
MAGVLPEYLGPFHRNHPGIQIEIVSVEDHEQLIDSVRLGRADLAFGVDERIPADLQARFVRKQRFTAVLSTDLAHAVRTALDAELLGGLTLVTLPQGTSTRLITDEVYRNLGVTAPRIITTTQRDALVQLSIAVGGITMVPQVLASTAEVFGGLQVPLAADAGRPIGAIFRKDSFKNPALEEFLDHL